MRAFCVATVCWSELMVRSTWRGGGGTAAAAPGSGSEQADTSGGLIRADITGTPDHVTNLQRTHRPIDSVQT